MREVHLVLGVSLLSLRRLQLSVQALQIGSVLMEATLLLPQLTPQRLHLLLLALPLALRLLLPLLYLGTEFAQRLPLALALKYHSQ